MPSTSDRLYDANDLTQWVNERDANGLQGCTLEEDGSPHRCAFTLEGSIDQFKKQGERLCVIIDSTFSKNRLGLRLVSFTAITENGHTKVKFCNLFTSKILSKILHEGSYVL